MSLRKDIKLQFRSGNVLMQLIYINAGLFLLLNVIRALLWLFGQGQLANLCFDHLGLPASISTLATRPWTLLTHMFVHRDLLHGLFNLLWLYFSGTLFLSFLSQRQLLSTYLLGGLSGALFYSLGMNFLPAFAPVGMAFGASAAVLSILVSVAVLRPGHMVYLVLIGGVRLKYIALVLVLLDVIMLPMGNGGGHLGHLGGAMFGLIYGLNLRSGRDLSINFLASFTKFTSLFKRKPSNLKVAHRRPLTDDEFNERRKVRQTEVDAILDKIKKSGYDSLSTSEREVLFKASKEM